MTGPTFATHAPASPPRAPRPAPKTGERPDDAAGARILVYLKLHWLMVLFCGTLIGAAGAAVAWELLASKYESYGLFRVSAVPINVVNHNSNSQPRADFATYVKTLTTQLRSEDVLNAALRDIKDLPTIKAQKDPLKFLEEELDIRGPEGEVIRITFKGHEPEDARKIINAVQKAFVERVQAQNAQQIQKIAEQSGEAQKRMEQIVRTDRRPKSGGAGVVTAGGATAPAPLPAPPGAPGTPAGGAAPTLTQTDRAIYTQEPGLATKDYWMRKQQVEQLTLNLNALTRNRDVLQSQLKAIQDSPTQPLIAERVENDGDVSAARRLMVEAQITWMKYAGNSEDPNGPAIQEFRKTYEAYKRRYEALKDEKIKTIEGVRKLQEAKPLAAELQAVIFKVQEHQEKCDEAKKALALLEKYLAELPPGERGGLTQARFEKEYNPDDSRLAVTDGIWRELMQQYHLTQLELEAPARISVLQQASTPTQKDTKKQLLGTGFASVIGFVLMGLGVVGYETVSRRVSSLADVRAAVPTPVVGVIPGLPTDAAGKDPVRRAAANEAIDKLRAYVSQTWLSRGATAITVTSPIGDEGKAFTAFGLASSLAQAGYKTLLVDFDLREPAIHPYAGVPNAAGVCELLRAETDMRSVVQFLPSGLHLLPAGKWSDEARKAATGEKLEALLAKLREPYDCVVIHGHALLTVAESVEVARRCEAVLVCARYRETATPLLKRAAERVATMEIPFSGVVYVGATEQEALC
ncbi:Tyrosine-protein kinase ptk [Gemmata obscuriglobus]|uniref:CobQ/CobB/MinD/ParA nucleotide binding domain-containing protein n=1 Tax=Gemmata obscuriglobus TaxID=114 RepID=A0A2Z3H3Z6_9BACT|nr:polysaccharide biosynthesis tyrosine autokinase [Gemmata obscuriglobus]AWM41509.1 hypothetical protein C1280_33920 [Gemmata obscuriglobus]QEG32583.1 Tyrosine-protein kinase ptk [Gemmata obscuriglobus]VTS11939.1 protein-tyrosine kinase : Capsular exopolysaccharide biosynthesis protein OS=Singulisphaera acidiphila (strain ATCC BAA-1392 / DSM 18658 / VKM B-2454 / MOB10) GN=Sinac_2488 PE=4 SV=1: Wzz: AAA_31 [Gemmata obscuriglobus UQM 2246]